MTDKPTFEAKLNDYGRACQQGTGPEGMSIDQARAAVLAAYDDARVRDADADEPNDPPLPEFAAAGREGQPAAIWRVAPNGNSWLDWKLPLPLADGTKLYTHPAPKADADWVCVPRSVALSAAAEIEQMMDQEGCAPALRPMRAVLRNKLREAAADWLCVPRELMERVDFVLACAGLASIQDGERTFNDVHAMLAASPARGGDDRDAARYRWLRQREVHINTRLFCRPGRSESLDKQIDAAMSREAQG